MMKLNYLKILWFSVFLSSFLVGFSQSFTVSGTITDDLGETLPGVTVIISGTSTGTITDFNGIYQIEVPSSDAKLMYSFVGYETIEIDVNAQTVIDVLLPTSVSQLEEVVVTGYSVEKKKDLLGAVAVLDLDQAEGNTNNNIMQTLQGRVAGVQVDLAGEPGQGAKIKIRGNSTLGNNNPLYIVDGVPVQPFDGFGATSTITPQWGLSWLNPNDIESIQILKDAASASIYGSRASNGVVIITTKQPNKSRSSITVNARISTESVRARADLLNNEQKATLQWQAAVNDGADPDAGDRYRYQWHLDPSLGPGIQGTGVPVLDEIIYPDWLDEADQLRPSGHPSSKWTGTEFGGKNVTEGTDWNDVIYRTGIIHNYDIAFSQGSEKGGVHLSLNLFDQRGAVIHSGYQRIAARMNSNYSFLDGRVTIGENLNVTKGERQWSDNGFGGTVESLMRVMKPILPVKTEDGRFAGPPGAGFDDRDNPAGLGDDNKNDRINNVKIFGNAYLNVNIIKGLNFRTNLGIDYDNIFSRDIFPTFSRGFLNNTTAELQINQVHQTNLVFNNTLTYSNTFAGQHTITALVGTESVENQIQVFSASGKDFALETNEYFQLNAASGERNSIGSSTGFSLFSYFGKVNYDFSSKYLASFTIRRDGSSRFGTRNRYAVFPAASVGWRLSEEAFLKNSSFISNLKLRAAWGQTGNQDIENTARFALFEAVYAPQSTYLPWGGGCAQTICQDAATSYDIGNNNTGILPSGFLATQTANDELKWETTTELNFGLDFGFMNERIAGSVEVFHKETEDILIKPSFIGTFGDGANRWANGANMETDGWELSVGYFSVPGKDFTYSVSGVFSHYSDKITNLPEDLFASFPGNQEQNIVGRSPNAFFGYRTDGILQSQAEVEQAPEYPGIRVGAFKYVDLNNDGIIDALDQEYQGVASQAGVEFGFNTQIGWKSFDFTMQLTGALDRRIAGDAGYNELGSLAPGRTAGVASLNAWSPTNTNTHIPAASTSTRPLGFADYDIRSGDYLALRQITLGWNLPQNVSSPFADLRVYVSGENLHFFQKTSGSDASYLFGSLIERTRGARVGGGFGSIFPRPLRLTLGVEVGF